jgi:hypothetical protein
MRTMAQSVAAAAECQFVRGAERRAAGLERVGFFLIVDDD